MSCSNIISYSFSNGPLGTIGPVTAAGILNGKPYYTLEISSNPFIIYWNGTSWVFGSLFEEDTGNINVEDLAFFTPTIATDCPLDIDAITEWTFYNPETTATFTTESEGTFEENLCSCKVIVTYQLFKASSPTTVELVPAGIISGYNYYTFTVNIGGDDDPELVDVIMYYDNSLGSWVVKGNTAIDTPYFNETFASFDTDGEIIPCPESDDWKLADRSTEFSTTLDCSSPIAPPQSNPAPLPDPNDPNECYDILVWSKQCEFAKCVFKYVQKLQYGTINTCEELDTLINKKRALEILNCYDSRDIEGNTTDYNFITYSEIKKLLNS